VDTGIIIYKKIKTIKTDCYLSKNLKIKEKKEEMVDRITTAVKAKKDPDFVIMARTDSLANEGIEKAIQRGKE
jgi:2-methylisocitrate lyase-like PEP mutase family enzyme